MEASTYLECMLSFMVRRALAMASCQKRDHPVSAYANFSEKLHTLRELIFANFGQFRENFFREKSKIDRFAKISSREISKFPSFAKINSVFKFAKNRIFAYS